MSVETLHEKRYEYGDCVSNPGIFSVSFDVSLYKYIKSINAQVQMSYSGEWIRGLIRLQFWNLF